MRRPQILPLYASSWKMLIGLSLLLSILIFWSVPNLGFDSDDRDYLQYAAERAANSSQLLSPVKAFPFGRPTTELFFLLGHTLWQEQAQHYHLALIMLHIARCHTGHRRTYRIGCFSSIWLLHPVASKTCLFQTPLYLHSAIYLKSESRYQEAIAFAERALAIRPHYAKAFYVLGIIHAGIGECDPAIEALRRAIHFDLDNLDAYEALGDIRMVQRQKQEAIKIYQQALQRAPERRSIQNKLAQIRHRKTQQE